MKTIDRSFTDPLFELTDGAGSRRWLFLGDSITQGAEHTYGQRDYTQLFQERVRYEMSRPKDLVLNAAVSGATVSACLTDLDRILAGYVPDVAFVMLGTNDASENRAIAPEDFARDLGAVVSRLRKAGAQVILQTPNPIIPEGAAPYTAQFAPILAKIRAVAEEDEVALVDHEEHWNSYFSANPKAFAAYFMCDGIHPNALGHRLLATGLFKALDIFDPMSLTCRLFVP